MNLHYLFSNEVTNLVYYKIKHIMSHESDKKHKGDKKHESQKLYIDRLPRDVCELLVYYIGSIDLIEVLKIKCCKNFINKDLFWKNKMRCNYPLSFIDDLPLEYYKKLYRKRAQNDLRQLEYILCETDYVLHPHIKLDLGLQIGRAHV